MHLFWVLNPITCENISHAAVVLGIDQSLMPSESLQDFTLMRFWLGSTRVQQKEMKKFAPLQAGLAAVRKMQLRKLRSWSNLLKENSFFHRSWQRVIPSLSRIMVQRYLGTVQQLLNLFLK